MLRYYFRLLSIRRLIFAASPSPLPAYVLPRQFRECSGGVRGADHAAALFMSAHHASVEMSRPRGAPTPLRRSA